MGQGESQQFHSDLLSTTGLREEKAKVSPYPRLHRMMPGREAQELGVLKQASVGQIQLATEGHGQGEAGVSWPLQASRSRFCSI